MTDMVPWIGFVFNEVIVIRRKTRGTDILIMKINHGHKVLEFGWQSVNKFGPEGSNNLVHLKDIEF